jgi:hypothetical protein
MKIYGKFVNLFSKNLVSAQSATVPPADTTDSPENVPGVEKDPTTGQYTYNGQPLPQDENGNVNVGSFLDSMFDFSYGFGEMRGFGGLPRSGGEAISAAQSMAFIAAETGGGSSMCTKMDNGAQCMVLSNRECQERCDGECIEISSIVGANRKISEVAPECVLGTCIDPDEGICSPQTPKRACEEGEWYDDPFANIPQCRRGCCVLGTEAQFINEQECRSRVEQSGMEIGVEAEFYSNIIDEPHCLDMAGAENEGACILLSEEGYACQFTKKAVCNQKRGDFRENFLCSNQDLKNEFGYECERQVNASCVDGLEAMYWFDSCGNRENIYDSDRDQSWNGGKILARVDSCSIGTGDDPLQNQATCGNCVYAASSKCGVATETEKVVDEGIDFVCRSLRCTDRYGNVRENGESWCAYQSSIGVDGILGGIPGMGFASSFGNLGPIGGIIGGARSTDTPGSLHWREACSEGEIITEQCQGYRNEICAEMESPQGTTQTFSQAVCRPNRWQECLNYNSLGSSGVEGRIQEIAGLVQCELNPDCFMKHVEVDDDFKFDVCLPKYPPGSDFSDGGESSQTLCSLQARNVLQFM